MTGNVRRNSEGSEKGTATLTPPHTDQEDALAANCCDARARISARADAPAEREVFIFRGWDHMREQLMRVLLQQCQDPREAHHL